MAATVGALIAACQPRNVTGWICLGVAVFGGVGGAAEGFLGHRLQADASAPGSPPDGE